MKSVYEIFMKSLWDLHVYHNRSLINLSIAQWCIETAPFMFQALKFAHLPCKNTSHAAAYADQPLPEGRGANIKVYVLYINTRKHTT